MRVGRLKHNPRTQTWNLHRLAVLLYYWAKLQLAPPSAITPDTGSNNYNTLYMKNAYSQQHDNNDNNDEFSYDNVPSIAIGGDIAGVDDNQNLNENPHLNPENKFNNYDVTDAEDNNDNEHDYENQKNDQVGIMTS